MPDTTIRVKDETHKAIVKARGAFEQTFGTKLTFDETIFLSASYINIAYEELQNLLREGLIKIAMEKDGTVGVEWSKLEQVTKQVLPRIIIAFENFKAMLTEKEERRIYAKRGNIS
jgi:hypothetical protein